VERFGASRLFEDQVEPPSSPLYWVLGLLCLVLLLAALYVYLQSPRRFGEHRLHRRLARRYAILVGGFSGLGLATVTFGFLTVPFLSKRLWLAAALAGLAATAAHAALYFRRRYPAALLAYRERERRQRYLPRPKGAARKRRARRQ
jgi:hypothetical protein